MSYAVAIPHWHVSAALLEEQHGLPTRGYVDLAHLARRLGVAPNGVGLATLAASFVGQTLRKEHALRCGDWAAPTLSEQQVEYAAKDAWVAQAILLEMYRRHSTVESGAIDSSSGKLSDAGPMLAVFCGDEYIVQLDDVARARRRRRRLRHRRGLAVAGPHRRLAWAKLGHARLGAIGWAGVVILVAVDWKGRRHNGGAQRGGGKPKPRLVGARYRSISGWRLLNADGMLLMMVRSPAFSNIVSLLLFRFRLVPCA
eukprot:SAG11_NODE_203_length_12529_cov_6.036444_3_plen_256_part_00